MILEKFFSSFSRGLYFIPGGYFIVKVLKRIFDKQLRPGIPAWREFSFQGIKMRINIAQQMSGWIYWRGVHDWGPIYAMKAGVKPGDTFIDVGANLGEYALWAAKLTGYSGKVLAFEPLTEMFDLLNTNVALNEDFKKNIVTIKCGLSDSVEEVPIYTSGNAGIDGLHEGLPTIFKTDSRNIFVENIKLDTLDNQVEKSALSKVDWIKIDVEGAELKVLRGAKKTIKRFHPALLLECNKDTSLAGGYTQESIFQFLDQFGYEYFIIGNRGGQQALDRKAIPEFCNIVARRT
jgi:FkbM family methyltransferase